MPLTLKTCLRALLLAAGIFGAGFLLSHSALGAQRGAHGVRAMAAFIATSSCLIAAGLPRQAACFAAGVAFGAIPGLAMALAAQILGAALSFFWARFLAQNFVHHFLARRQGGHLVIMLTKADRLLARAPFLTTLTLRLLPISNNLVLNLFAGASTVRTLPFLTASLIGFLPQSLVFTLAGSGLQISRLLQILLAAALLIVSSVIGTITWRRLGVPAV
jgi:uncharacterized membrane protein YdjX (TVP38/TMEM64 family)